MTGCDCSEKASQLNGQKVLLLWLLGLNALMFVVEGGAGLIAHSSGLLADALDMLADAAVYAIALWAVGRQQAAKNRAAAISGVCQLVLAVGVIVESVRRLVEGHSPDPGLMMWVAALAFAVNLLCMGLLSRHRHGEIHLRASWLFSTSDVLANLSVMVGGALVALTGQGWPDLVIGVAIALLIARTGWVILRQARQQSGAARAAEQGRG